MNPWDKLKKAVEPVTTRITNGTWTTSGGANVTVGHIDSRFCTLTIDGWYFRKKTLGELRDFITELMEQFN